MASIINPMMMQIECLIGAPESNFQEKKTRKLSFRVNIWIPHKGLVYVTKLMVIIIDQDEEERNSDQHCIDSVKD